MKNLNFIIVEGNLVRDPDYRVTETGLPMCRFTLANNYSFKKNDQWVTDVNFINIVCWARTAENCGTYLKRGHPVRVKGRIDQSYIKHEDGHGINMIDIVAQSVEFLPRRRRAQDEDGVEESAMQSAEAEVEFDEQVA
ncbi:MAG: single-stranded DNA-binding protein [Spirochaetota bacterium]|jgi:single-strand DNA-binding protein|nr:single-stranded DNA-binding protein [Spirochaetota bacterium]